MVPVDIAGPTPEACRRPGGLNVTRVAIRSHIMGPMGASSTASLEDRLPTFLLIGAQKAGTTSLYEYLRSHPQVFMPRYKEPNFFVLEQNWGRGLEWYKQWFRPADSARAIGEASTRYTMYPMHDGVPERIASTLSAPKLVYVVRDPIDRMVSHYLHLVSKGTTRAPLKQALLGESWYITVSSYGLQLSRYLSYFPRDQICVVVSEELRAEREQTLAQVFAFLGVPPASREPVVANEYNPTADKLAPRGLVRPLTLIPNWYRMTRRLPEPVKAVGRKITHKPLPSAEVPRSLRRELAARLHDDVALLRQFMPPSFDGWGIA
jgi:hypothetical protein